MKINWLRVVVGVNIGMTVLLFYLLWKLHDVVNELGYALIFWSEVLSFVVK